MFHYNDDLLDKLANQNSKLHTKYQLHKIKLTDFDDDYLDCVMQKNLVDKNNMQFKL